MKEGAFSVSKSSLLFTNPQSATPGGTPVYVLTARDQYNNPISGYQFKMALDVKNEGPIVEKVTVNGSLYLMPQTTGTNKTLPVSVNDIPVTNELGQATVTINYFGGNRVGRDYDSGDGVGPKWYDNSDARIFN